MGRVEFRRPCPPLQASRLCLHGGQEGRAGGGQRCARGGDRRRGWARLLRAAEMRLKTSGSDGGGRSARGGGGGGGGGGSCRAAGATETPAPAEDAEGTGPGPSPPPPRWPGREEVCCPSTRWCPHGPRAGGGRRGGRSRVAAPPPPPLAGVIGGLLPPHPSFGVTPPPGSPRSARLGVWRFAGLEASGPWAGEGRVPSTLGGAAHRRAAGGPESGRAWDAGQARPSQEDSAAAPARRASGTSTWRPGATRGGATGQPEPPEEPVWPSWPARQQPLIPQPKLLHRAHDGAPCSKQSTPCVPLPAPGARLRYGAASGTCGPEPAGAAGHTEAREAPPRGGGGNNP